MLTTLAPRVVALIAGNVYTSAPATVNVCLVPYVVENSKETGSAVVAVYATRTVRAVGLTTALVSGVVVVLLTLRPNSSEAFVDGKSAAETNANVSCASDPTTSLCVAETFEETDPVAVGTHAGRGVMALDGTVLVSSVLRAPSGPRNLTLSVRSAAVLGVIDPIVMVSSSFEQLRTPESIGVSTPLCANRAYSSCVATSLECSPSPPVNVSVREPAMPCFRWIPARTHWTCRRKRTR
jgi:hypothetical protein